MINGLHSFLINQKIENLDDFLVTGYEEKYHNRPMREKLAHSISTAWNSSLYYLSMAPKILSNQHCTLPEETYHWDKEKKGLFVILHGLKGSPIFSPASYRDQIEKEFPGKYEIKVLYVPDAGNCPLKKAAEPFIEMVRDYVEANPGKPVTVIGTSNGARIAGAIDCATRDKEVNMRIVGIVGAFFGSRTMSIADHLGLAKWFFDADVVDELKEGSDVAKKLIQDMQAPVEKGSRCYDLSASENDLLIPNTDGCFPRLKNAEYHLENGFDHVSLAGHIQNSVLQRAYLWMDNRS